MKDTFRTPLVLSGVIAALMAVQAAAGIVFQSAYRDTAWIAATWYGNDWVTLVAGVPLLVAGIVLASRGSVRGVLLWVGMLGYAFYNYTYYLLGVALSVFFPIHVVLVVLSAVTLILALPRVDAGRVRAAFGPRTPRRIVGGYFTFVAVGFAFAWLAQWAAYAFAGTVPSIGAEPFKLVAALDLTIMMPLLGFGGVLLWRRHPWGYVVASVAAAQGTLYLLVLTVNSFVLLGRGLAEGLGEVPVWGTFALLTGACLAALLASAGGSLAE